jgi:probable rRNA maturation factor
MEAPLVVDVDVLKETPLPDDAEPERLAPLVRYVLEAEGKSGYWTLTVALTSDQALRSMHREFMGIDTETDVMTFPVEPTSLNEASGGDIAISLERAADQAPDYDQSIWNEVRFLVVHGTLHLCGWDDTSDDDRTRMLARQRELIDSFDRDEEV